METREIALTQINQKSVRQDGSERCGDCPIRYRAVCAHCETDELSLLEGMKFYRSFEPGQPIVWEGERMEFVGSVVTGVQRVQEVERRLEVDAVGVLCWGEIGHVC